MTDTLSRAAARLDAWIEREEFKGWDPYDALNSPLLRRLTFDNRRVGQVWVQLLKRSPLNLRPLLGVAKGYNPKGMGLFLASYWRKYLLTGNKAYLERVEWFADWLRANISPGYSGACWGYNFDWPNRGFFAAAGTPTIVNTAFIGLAFLDLCRQRQVLDGSVAPSERPFGSEPLLLARSACDFLLNDLHVIHPAQGELCFAYTPLDRRYIHNANILGAWLLAEVYALTSELPLASAAAAAARYTACQQQPDGSWRYGEGASDGWVDNFHTGYVLVGLKHISAALEMREFDEAIDSGYRFWKERMFLSDGTPKYYASRLYPIDIHSVAQAIITSLEFADRDHEAWGWARRVAEWGIANMQDAKGYFYHQIHRGYRIRTPFMRWSQAWMQRALTELAWHSQERSVHENLD